MFVEWLCSPEHKEHFKRIIVKHTGFEKVNIITVKDAGMGLSCTFVGMRPDGTIEDDCSIIIRDNDATFAADIMTALTEVFGEEIGKKYQAWFIAEYLTPKPA